MLHTRDAPARELVRHPVRSLRLMRLLPTHSDSLFDRVAAFIAPWTRAGYPGRARVLVSTVGWRVSYDALTKWGRAGRRVPVWAADAFAAHIRSQCEVGLALAEELERHAAELRAVPHHLSAAGRMAAVRAARRPGSAMGARARQLPRVVPETEASGVPLQVDDQKRDGEE